jgi:hypothetical protein
MKSLLKTNVIYWLVTIIVNFTINSQVAPAHGTAISIIVMLVVDMVICLYIDMVAKNFKEQKSDNANNEN